MVIVPGDAPGARMPPFSIVTVLAAPPTVPKPASVAPFWTLTARLAIEPSTYSVPVLIVVGPV